ncbi:MAG: hypothetical protein GY787_24875 [Alteromonadales bacterium]|nr:hypothetical protein [Alteromonadales bacterium]
MKSKKQTGRKKGKNSWVNNRTLVPPRAVGLNVSQEKWDSIFGHKADESTKGK